MTDGQGFGYGIGGGSTSTDDFILDFGMDSTDGAYGDRVPEGTHKFAICAPYEILFTNDGEPMIITDLQVIESTTPGARGITHRESTLIPSQERRNNDPDKWKKMMKFLRLKLEGMTGKSFREDNVKFNPAEELPVGLTFVATVKHVETQKDGKTYTNAQLSNFIHVPTGGAGGAESFGGFGGMGVAQTEEEPF